MKVGFIGLGAMGAPMARYVHAKGLLTAVGNRTQASADAVWNGPVAIELRSYIRDDKVHPVCAGAPCKYVQATQARPDGTAS